MATRKPAKRRKTRGAGGTQFLVVRGKGNTVFLAIAAAALKDTALSKMLDGYRLAAGDGVTRASRAFVVKGKKAVTKFLGDHSIELYM
jgi:hypothetical protein